MKKTIIFTLSLMAALYTNAQVDVKINPIGALFGSPDLSAEFALSENFGAEVSLGFNLGNNKVNSIEFRRSGIAGFLAGKYYFNPEQSIDKFGIGLYTRFRNISNKAKDQDEEINNWDRSVVAAGFLVAYKWVSESGVIFEVDFGAGRIFSNKVTFNDEDNSTVDIADIPVLNIDVIGRLAIGYRF